MLEDDKINHYLQFFHLNLEDLMQIFDLAEVKILEEGAVYIREGSNTRKLAYIKEGLMRTYHLQENGEEITVLIHWEDNFFGAHDSIFFNRPSRFTYLAMEPTVLLEVDYDRFMDLLNSDPKLGKAKDHFSNLMLAEALERVESFVMLNPEERYLNLIRKKPNIVQRCPDKYIATMLGITPVSLSRIRKRLSSKSNR